MKVVIVGGVTGGVAVATRLRRLRDDIEIILIEKGNEAAFASCGLPYLIGGVVLNDALLKSKTADEFLKIDNIQIRTNHEVLAINSSSKTLQIQNLLQKNTYQETYDFLVLATGVHLHPQFSMPVKLDEVFAIRSVKETLRLKTFIEQKNPHRAVVVGGGYSGLEMAENLREAGLKVTLVETHPHLLKGMDADMATLLQNYAEDQGIRLMLNNKISMIEKIDNALTVTLNERSFETDLVVVTEDLVPRTELAKTANLQLNAKGFIVVDGQLKTNQPGIFALGGSIQETQSNRLDRNESSLANAVMKQARVVAENILGKKSVYRGLLGSAFVKFFDLQVGLTGLTEETAIRLGLKFQKSYIHARNHTKFFGGSQLMTIKLIYEVPSGQILGAQIVGHSGTDKRLDVFATALHGYMTIHDLAELELSFAPELSLANDAVNYAGFAAQNALNGLCPLVYHEEVLKGVSSSTVLVDVREADLYEDAHIEESINIPLTELRDALKNLDKTKKYIVIGQLGDDGYIATRILLQAGFQAANLSGGFRLYDALYMISDCPTCND